MAAAYRTIHIGIGTRPTTPPAKATNNNRRKLATSSNGYQVCWFCCSSSATISIHLTIENQEQHEDTDRAPKIESRAKRTGDAMTWMDRRRAAVASSSVCRDANRAATSATHSTFFTSHSNRNRTRNRIVLLSAAQPRSLPESRTPIDPRIRITQERTGGGHDHHHIVICVSLSFETVNGLGKQETTEQCTDHHLALLSLGYIYGSLHRPRGMDGQELAA